MSLLEVARAAVAECSGYDAVAVAAMPRLALRPGTADEVAHILAELLDNALTASAGQAVTLSSAATEGGWACFRVDDAGPIPRPGMVEHLNALLEQVPQLAAHTPRHMGLYVAAVHAGRLGVRVRLEARDGGGITASVYVPPEHVLKPPPQPIPAPSTATRTPPPERWGATVDTRQEAAQPGVGGLPRRRRSNGGPGREAPGRVQMRRPDTGSAGGAGVALDRVRHRAADPAHSQTEGNP
jgi:hypothetical protein